MTAGVGALSLRRQLEGARLIVVGGTGFLGKVWLSLLLTQYPDVDHVWLMVRERRDSKGRLKQSSEQRFWADIATSPVFDPLRKLYPGGAYEAFLRQKLTPIPGDVTDPGCGVPAEICAQLKGRLTAFVNASGVVDFNPPLDEALNVNAFGVRNMVELARALSAEGRPLPLLHTSTCYVAGDRTGQVDEVDPREFPFPRCNELDRSHWDAHNEIRECLDVIENVRHRAQDAFRQSHFLDQAKKNLKDKNEPGRGQALQDELEKVRRKFVEQQLVEWGTERAKYWGWHNIYTYTKSIGEQIVASSGLPFTIVRPAVVESSLTFPMVGWNEGINTSAPLIYMALQGPVVYPSRPDTVLDVIPVDQVAIGMMLSLGELLEGSAPPVYQYGSSDTCPCPVDRLIELTGLYRRKHYLDKGKGNPLLNKFLARLEPVPARPENYYSWGPRWQGEQVRKASSWLKGFAEGGVRGLVTTATEALDATVKQLGVQAYVTDQFVPFMATHNYRFSCARTRAAYGRLEAAEKPELHWHPEDIDWRHYFLEVHIPGLEKHVYPELDAKLKKDKAPLRRHDHMAAFLDDIAERHELAPALLLAHEDGFSRRSYREFRGRALAVAIRLHAAGVRKGDRVLLSGQNHPDWLTVWFGVLRLGAVVVPIDPGLKPDAVRGIRRSCEPVGAIVDQKARDTFGEALHGLDSWDIHEMAAPGAVGHLPPVELVGEDLASLLYTSGTTGDPKGVMLSHANFTSMLGSLGRLFPLEPDDRVLCVLPMHHGFELMGGQLLPLSMGARVHYLDEVNADRLSWGLREGRITCMVGVPALWQLLERRIRSQVKEKGQLFELAFDAMLDANRSMGKALGLDVGPLLFGTIHSRFGGNIRMLISGGSALPAETQRLFIGLGLPMSEGYGMTEASPVLTVALPSPGAKVGHVGKPVPGVQLRIHAPDDKGVGEVWARGPNVMQGYFGNAAATEAVLDREGWLHTGDLGKLDHQGRLTILGRAKDVVVSSSGENIYLDDVEKALGRLRGVKELCLVGVADPRGGERLGLLAVADLGEGKERNSVHDEAQASLKAAIADLPAFQRPAVVHIVDADLPRNASRKVLRKKVREVLEKIAAAAPERKRGEGLLGPVARAVAAVAGVPEERVGMESRLAQDFGFDSLMWVELASALEGAGEGRPDPQSLSACETVADVVRLVGAPAPVQQVEEEDEGEEIVLPEWLTEPIKDAFGLVQDRFNGQALGTRVVGRAFIPSNRSCIVVSNHTSHLDMGLVKHALGPYGERMRALAAQDYFFEGNRWKVAWFRNFTNIAPLDRNAGFRASYRQARDIIEQGEVVLIFPEATRQTSGRMAEFKPLVGKLSLDTGTDILPMFIEGAYEAMPKGASFPRKRGIKIRIGPPLEVSELRRLTAGMSTAEAARTATRLTQMAVEALRDGGVLDLKRMAAEKAREEASKKVETLEETVDRVMRALPARLSLPLVEREATWYWTLLEGPRYTVQVTAEGCTVSPGKPAGSADCVVKTSSDIFLKITTQSYVPDPEEFISGAIKTSDIPLLIEFSRIFQLSDTSGVAL